MYQIIAAHFRTRQHQQKADFVEHDEEEVSESNGQDTGKNGAQNAKHDVQYYDELETILEEDEEEDKDPQITAKQDVDDLDMIAYNPDESEEEPFNMAIDDTSEDPTIVTGKPVTFALVSDDV